METTTCSFCGGDGYIDDTFCTTCMGGGSVPVVGINQYLKKVFDDIKDKCNDIKEKVDEIFENQQDDEDGEQ